MSFHPESFGIFFIFEKNSPTVYEGDQQQGPRPIGQGPCERGAGGAARARGHPCACLLEGVWRRTTRFRGAERTPPQVLHLGRATDADGELPLEGSAREGLRGAVGQPQGSP